MADSHFATGQDFGMRVIGDSVFAVDFFQCLVLPEPFGRDFRRVHGSLLRSEMWFPFMMARGISVATLQGFKLGCGARWINFAPSKSQDG